MPETTTAARLWVHHDMQDDQKLIACYEDIGIGPAVVFDGGGFNDPQQLRRFATELQVAADWLEEVGNA